MELMNSTQRVIAVLQKSFKSVLFAALVQVFLGLSDLWWWSEVEFQIKVNQIKLKHPCREICFWSFLEHEGGGTVQDTALTLPHQVSSKGFTSFVQSSAA